MELLNPMFINKKYFRYKYRILKKSYFKQVSDNYIEQKNQNFVQ